MPVQTRNQKKEKKKKSEARKARIAELKAELGISENVSSAFQKIDEKHEVDAALVLLKVKKDNADMWNSLMMEEELKKKKDELIKLKKVKRYTDRYNNLKEIISIYTQRADRLEMKITEILSSIDN